MTKKYCYRCEWLYRWPEHFYSSFFRDGSRVQEKWSERLWFPLSAMCQHSACFENKERIQGQHQLNKNKDCPYYKKKWYLKFWDDKI